MNAIVNYVFVVAGLAMATQAVAQITFYEREDFGGRSFTTERRINNFDRHGFNDRASSAMVQQERWEVCQDVRHKGRCVVLRPGRYPSLAAMGLDDRISSVRTVDREVYIDEHRYAPRPETSHNYRRGRNERLYQAEVTSVHAVVGPPEQRCWMEREQVPQPKASANVPGAIAGALIGGILGHQVGGGRGQDLATAGGAVAGAVVGSKVGNGGQQDTVTQDVRRCETTPSQAKPDYWDVTYVFQNQEHRVQMTTPPGRTVTVNERGEPRS